MQSAVAPICRLPQHHQTLAKTTGVENEKRPPGPDLGHVAPQNTAHQISRWFKLVLAVLDKLLGMGCVGHAPAECLQANN
eukprot:1578244-Lingulodinium_polyedra.AAC.1